MHSGGGVGWGKRNMLDEVIEEILKEERVTLPLSNIPGALFAWWQGERVG